MIFLGGKGGHPQMISREIQFLRGHAHSHEINPVKVGYFEQHTLVAEQYYPAGASCM